MALPPLLPGESTTKFSAVDSRLTLYGDMYMTNTNSNMVVTANASFTKMTVTNLSVTNNTVTSLVATNITSGTLNVTGETVGTLAVVGVTSATGLRIKEGAGGKQGTAVLVAGAVTVANTSVTATSRIFLTSQDISAAGTNGALSVASRSAGVNFVVQSSEATDASTVAYEIFEAA